ncbi:MAG TPA: MFS transporter [Polyangiaceae bacterium]|jgi:predicted MFS family arabinose efflux permease|nr:MFS transporter [Polyangiaceae bacterium]
MNAHAGVVVSDRAPTARRPAALYWLALGTFAIGTEGFMIAALLTTIAADIRVSVAEAGLLVSIFALAYATSSPLLTALTGRVDRRQLLLGSMSLFAAFNMVAAQAHSFLALAAARVLLAFAAGLFTPNANALAGALVPAEQRGRAIAIVNGGLTAAIALGVPLGALVGERLGWRMTFVGVGVLSAIAAAGLARGLQRGVGASMVSASLRDRVQAVRNPRVARTLAVTTLWATGSYAVYTYVAPLLYAATPLRGSQIGFVLCTWGVAAGIGLFVSGNATDRFGTKVVLRVSLTSLVLALAGLAVVANVVAPAAAVLPVLAAVALWGMSSWAFFPAQQTRFIELVGVTSAPVALSLNASFMYLGFSLGAALGGFSLLHVGPRNLGFVGAVCDLAALMLLLVNQARDVRSQSERVVSASPNAASTAALE